MNLFPENTDKDFIVQFDRVIELGPNCTVELLEFRCWLDERNRETFYILCDLCENFTVFGIRAPVLRAVAMNGGPRRVALEFACPYQITSSCNSARSCRIYLRSRNLQPLSFEVSGLEVTVRLSYHDSTYASN